MKGETSKDNYRVWWIHPESDSEGFSYFQVWDWFKISDMSQEVIAYEQSTGIVDVLGKEIFEGDFVKGDCGYIGLVFWDEKKCMFDIKSNTQYFSLVTSTILYYDNIHENPRMARYFK